MNLAAKWDNGALSRSVRVHMLEALGFEDEAESLASRSWEGLPSAVRKAARARGWR